MSHVTNDIFEELKSDELSSWAVWDVDRNNTIDFFQSKLDILHSRFMFLGLNQSNEAKKCSNTYHTLLIFTTGQDEFLLRPIHLFEAKFHNSTTTT